MISGSNADCVEQLRQSVKSRIREPAKQYWEEAAGSGNADEAIKVCSAMLQDEALLERIMVARKYKLKESTDLVFEQVCFRAKMRPMEITPESIPNAIASGVCRLTGYSKQGFVIATVKAAKWNPDVYGQKGTTPEEQLESAVNEFVRYVVYMIELFIIRMRPLPVPQRFDVLFDFKDFQVGLMLQRNVRHMIQELIYVVQAQYPERLQKVYIVNPSLTFSTVWQFVKPLLDERTAAKVCFCNRVSELKSDITTEVLTSEYGGTHAEYPVPSKSLREELEEKKN